MFNRINQIKRSKNPLINQIDQRLILDDSSQVGLNGSELMLEYMLGFPVPRFLPLILLESSEIKVTRSCWQFQIHIFRLT